MSGPTRGAARRRRTLSLAAGLVLLASGLVVLGYLAWQMVGTDVVSRRAQERAVVQLHDRWQRESALFTDDAPALDEAASTPSAGAPSDRVPGADRGGRPRHRFHPPSIDVPVGKVFAVVRIPAFGKDYEVPVLEGVGADQLASGFGHFPDTVDPGQGGNYALAAHRVTHGEPLRRMPELRPGDRVIVETRDAVYTYRLDTDPNDLIVTFHGIWVIDPVPDNPEHGGVQPAQRKGQRLITLTTCAELFHTDNRMIAFGHLVKTSPKR